MKKFFAFLLFSVLFMSCSDSNLPNDDLRFALENTQIVGGKLTDKPMKFEGEIVTITKGTADAYTDKKGCFEFRQSTEDGTLTMFMHGPKFTSLPMPKLEMMVDPIAYTGKDKSVKFSVAKIAPQAVLPPSTDWQPFPAFMLTNIEGEINGTQCTVKFICQGKFDVTYTGRLLK